MRRKLLTIIIASAVLTAPATSRADGCGYGWAGFAAGLTFGFLIPATIAAVDAATRPPPPPYPYAYPYPVYYEAPPRPAPSDPQPPRAPARPATATYDSSVVGEIGTSQIHDPALFEAERLLRHGEFYKASESYRTLARERPADPQIALRFAESLHAVGNYRYAEYSLRRAIRAGLPLESLRAIGPAAKLAERRALLEKRLPLDGSGAGQLLAAYAAIAAGDRSGAAEHLRELLAASPGDLDALRLAGLPPSSGQARPGTVVAKK